MRIGPPLDCACEPVSGRSVPNFCSTGEKKGIFYSLSHHVCQSRLLSKEFYFAEMQQFRLLGSASSKCAEIAVYAALVSASADYSTHFPSPWYLLHGALDTLNEK